MPANGSGTGIGSAPRDIRSSRDVRTMAVIFSAAIRTSGWAHCISNVERWRGWGNGRSGVAACTGLDGAQRCGRRPRTRSPGSQCDCFGKQTATGRGEFGIHESDGAPEEKERRPKHQPPGYHASMMVR
jgi:hypothetical protein